MSTGAGGCRSTRHGTDSAYTDGCRCPVAREEWRLVSKRRREGRHVPRRHDALGTRRRLRALVALGWPPAVLAERLGVPPTEVSRLCHRARRVYSPTADRVSSLYGALCMLPGPSEATRLRARRAGWVPPLAWDGDLDDPAASPVACEPERTRPGRREVDEVAVLGACDGRPPRPLTVAERAEAVRRLAATGRSDAAVADLLHLTARAVLRIRGNLSPPCLPASS